MNSSQFVGGPCGSYGPYTFHRGFKFTKKGDGQCKVIQLGEFFFVRISSGHDPCIGELELLWHDRNTDQRLSSVRLYFLPEQTPDGRLASHGQDEMLMASDKVVLRLDDLICWITDQVDWNHGLLAVCWSDVRSPVASESLDSPITSSVTATTQVPDDQKEELIPDPVPDVLPEQDAPTPCPDVDTNSIKVDGELKVEKGLTPEPEENNIKEIVSSSPVVPSDSLCLTSADNNSNKEKDCLEISKVVDENELKVLILSYPTYCRYRTISKRVEGMADKWLKHALIIALGGLTNTGRNTHVMFCRDSFEHEELAHHELNCEYLAPTLKIKKRKRKGKNVRCTSPGSESNTSEEGKEVLLQNDVSNHNGFKQPPCKTEQEFLQRLYNFMKKRKTPIHRVPHLGFKQIDLFVFFSFAQKLGGYDKVTTKRLWKHVYDELGGDPGSTSAATCTRRHYERLLLPFERFMDGREYKPKQSRKQKTPMKKLKDEESVELSPQDEKTELVVNGKLETDDAYAFTDSNQENSKDSMLNEELHSGEELPFLNEAYSDEDSKSIWSIQKTGDIKEEVEKDENKQIKPLIIQKEQNESFSEKERKWNEIRRKNALARKWVRQLRPSRGSKSSGTEGDPIIPKQTPSLPAPPNSFKSEAAVESENVTKPTVKTALPLINNQHVKHEPSDTTKANMDTTLIKQLQDGLKPSPLSEHSNLNTSYEKNNYLLKSQDSLSDNVKFEVTKTVPSMTKDKSWCGYPRGSPYDIPGERYPYNNPYSMMQNFVAAEQNPLISMEMNIPRTMTHSSNLSETDTSNDDAKPNLSQRRPSVIQHTEFITSPSPSPSPKPLGSETCGNEAISRESITSFGSNSNPSTFKNQLSHTMAGKVSEWLAKGVPEAIACKTPSTQPVDKMRELHDKVIIPSVCQIPGPGSGKVPSYIKSPGDSYCISNTPKGVRSRTPGNYKDPIMDGVKKTSPYLPQDTIRNNVVFPQSFHPVTTLQNPLIGGPRQDVKMIASCPADKNRQYVDPFYNQPKRQRSTTPLSTSIPPLRPTLLPFVRQPTYRKSPHSDIPKTTPSSHTDYEYSVLDLSVKKKAPERTAPSKPSPNSAAGSCNSEPMCLDLSVKKKTNSSSNQDNAIENITPPITPSPKPMHQYTYYPSPRSSKPPTLIALQDMKKEETRQKMSNVVSSKANGALYTSSTAQSSIPLSSLAMSSNSVMFPGNAQNKHSQNIITSLPNPAFTKEMAKTLYNMPPDSMHFQPYVIPPFYAGSWTSANSANLSNNSAASPNSFKESVSHTVFPKQYTYDYKNSLHPLLFKGNGYYPPSCK